MWYFIENTFRYPKRKTAKLDRVWITVPSLVLILCICAAFVWNSEGIPYRYSGDLYMTKEEILANRKQYWKESNSKNKLLKGIPGEGHVMVLGNSHAIDLIYALRYNGLDSKITSLQTSGKCYNFGIPIKEVDATHCAIKKKENFNNTNWAIADVVYLHDSWSVLEIESLRMVLAEIRVKTKAPLFVFGPKMVYKEQVPEIVRASMSNTPSVINEYAAQFSLKELKAKINSGLKNEFSNPKYMDDQIYYIDMLTIQGGDEMNEFRIVSKDLKFLYFDALHLTETGSREIGAKLRLEYPYLFDISELKKEFPVKN